MTLKMLMVTLWTIRCKIIQQLLLIFFKLILFLIPVFGTSHAQFENSQPANRQIEISSHTEKTDKAFKELKNLAIRAVAFECLNIDSAIFYYENIIGLLGENGSNLQKSKLYAKLGIAYYQKSSSRKVADCFIIANKFAHQSNDMHEIGLSHNHLGDLYRINHQYKFALNHYFKALQVIDFNPNLPLCSSNFPEVEIKTINHIALVFFARKELDSALFYFQRMVNSPCNLSKSIGLGYQGLGCALMELGRYDEADDYLKKAIECSDKKNAPTVWTYAALDYAELNLKMGLFEKAENLISETIDLATKMRNTRGLCIAWGIKSALYDKLEIRDSSVKYLELHLAESDRIYSKENLRETTQAILAYETSERDLIIKEFDRRKETANERSLLLETRTKVLLIILIVFGVFLVLGIKRFKKQKRLTTGLRQKNFEILASQAQYSSATNQNQKIRQNKYEGSQLNTTLKNELIIKLNQKLMDQRVYLDPNLTLNSLAELLNVNRTYLSQIINESYHVSFNQLIAKYRVDEACKKLLQKDYQKYSVAGIGEICGFGSTVGFNRTFKKETGLTPSEFQKSPQELNGRIIAVNDNDPNPPA